jgi:hypothetical protein
MKQIKAQPFIEVGEVFVLGAAMHFIFIGGADGQ